ncbi:Lrp/AsnC family transcriptional regulator [Rhodoferax fermentans]|uniref:AsnC family transcriptional regulator n=1 Tax=Rhodoferax fermentans TaxID=28066 RepID=A0A1T1AWN6_RHOFE|nr:Lrp/AsnC family transcriptional regulator [Rhodoferax fermentans]MBK1685269.1 Lrp/AsnC family transcriptional regulator [Rhodoferax fermentans]OOV08539.1 AsnC family transcriptional regulator [Rhodoferax fermentans]
MKTQINDDSLLDKYDVALLSALQQDASATHQQLGELVHLSPSQVSRRITRLQASGIIRRTVALLDPARIGLGVRAISYVTLARHGEDEGAAFEQEIAAFPEVLECFAVTGESDYILQIVAASLNDLSESVLRRLTRIKVVNNIRSNIVLQSIKSSTELPLGQVGR